MLRILTLFLFISFTPSYAQQFENIVLDTDDGITRRPCEPSVAINLKDRDNIVGAAILDRAYISTDGGKTWTNTQLSSPHGVYGDPVVISDTKGDFYYFHLSDPTGENWASEEILDRIVCQKSEDGGQTWSEGESIGYNHPKDQDKEWAVVDLKTNNIYTTWTQFDEYNSEDPNCQSNILFSESKNGGKKWSDPIQLNQYAGDCKDDDKTVEGAVPAVGPDGQLMVAWAYDSKIYLDRSFDKGKTWLRFDIEVINQAGGWALDIPGLNRSNGMPILVCDNSDTRYRGSLYLNWSDQSNGKNDTDIWFMRSFNFGDSWEPVVRVNDDESGKHQFLSWMTVDQSTGYIYIVYYDRRAHEGLETDVYLAYSMNGGRSFENIKISESSFSPSEDKFFGDYLNVAAHDGRIVPIWTRVDDGKTSIVTTIIEQEDLPGVEPIVRSKKKKK